MREIKFRGKRIDNGEWVEGDVLNRINTLSKDKAIVVFDGYVIPKSVKVFNESIGQYTGLKDRNGKEIFEGDIVTNGRNHAVITFEYGCFNATPLDNRDLHVTIYEFNFTQTFKIIGNIHENPELLEVQYD